MRPRSIDRGRALESDMAYPGNHGFNEAAINRSRKGGILRESVMVRRLLQ